MELARYYRPSGRLSLKALLLAPLALPVAALAATVYSYVTLYLPIIGYVTVLLTVGLGFAVAMLAEVVLRRGRVRSVPFALLATAGLGLFTTWFMWVTWSYALVHQNDGELAFAALLWPPNLWELIGLVNEKGAWNIHGATPTGLLLWVLWAVEAGILVGFPVVTGLSVAREPYCEHCDAWCTHTKGVFLTPAVAKAEAAEHLERHDFGWLTSLGALSRPPPPAFTRWDLFECGCRATNAVSAVDVAVGVDGNGKAKVTETPLVDALLLPPDVLPAFQVVARKLAEPPPEAAAGSAAVPA